jgi:hypothetical protein
MQINPNIHINLKIKYYFGAINHYKISQFYRRKYSISVWLAVLRWFIYRRLHRRITFVGFPFVGDSSFRRYIGRKNKKIICQWFYRRNLHTKKNFPAWNIPSWKSVGDIMIYRRLYTVGKFVSECLKYRPNTSVCKVVGNSGSYCQMPTD